MEEAGWRRRVDFAVADEEGVCASRFSHLPAPVEHQRIVETAISRVMLRHGCDHVQPRCLCLSRRGIGRRPPPWRDIQADRSEEHTSELQSLMRISYAVFCLKKKTQNNEI